MGRLQRIEHKLERAINGAFAKAFRAEVQPVEIASAVRRAMDDRAQTLAKGRTLVPSSYTIELSPTDYERLSTYEADLREELLAAADEHAESQRYRPKGPFEVAVRRGEDLETGVFRITPEALNEAESAEDRRPARGAPAEKPATPQVFGRPEAERRRAETESRRGEVYDYERGDYERGDYGRGDDDRANDDRAGASRVDPEQSKREQPSDSEAPLITATKRTPPPRPASPRPAAMKATDRPWLEINGERYPLIHARTILGRDTGAQIVIDDPNVSRRHSEVRVTTDGPHLVANIRDLGSTNGTWVNDERVTSLHLHARDRIRIGQTEIVFHPGRR